MKVLVIQTAFIGDAILATAVLEKLHAHYPEARIDLLVQKSNASLFEGHPFLRKVLTFDKEQERLRSLISIIRQVRNTHYDVVINLHRFLSSGLITVLSGAKTRIGFDKNPVSRFYTSRVGHEISAQGKLHEVQRDLLLISDLTDDDLAVRPKLYPSAQDFDRVHIGEEYVCIAPASVWFTKQWPADKWVELIDRLDDRYLVCLIGSKQDKALCDSIKNSVKTRSIKVLAGELSLLESAALMKRAKMNFVNDSAPLHLASAMNATVAAIFCSTVPAFGFGPLSDKNYIAETELELDCRPCGLHGYRACPLGHFKCSEIEVADIVRKFNM